MKSIGLNHYKIGNEYPCFIIAEAGVNHNGSLDQALKMVDVAEETGADAIKFQTFLSDRVVSESAPKAPYQKLTTDSDETQLDMLKRLELPFSDFRKIQAYCQRKNIIFLSTPFDKDSATFLNDIGVPAFKIPSGEVTNHPFIGHIASFDRPIIMSTGMCELEEVSTSLEIIRGRGNNDIILLHCVSNYPAEPEDVNLHAIKSLAQRFNVPVGFSDHTRGIEISLAAVAMGACVIEKHFTLDRGLPGPDHQASLVPDELFELVRQIRNIEKAMGDGLKRPVASEVEMTKLVRRSLFAATDIEVGAILAENMIDIKRPGTGLPPYQISGLVGRIANEYICAGTMLKMEMFK